MYLKIFYDKFDALTRDIIYGLHSEGYKMELVYVGESRSNDDFISFYSRPIEGTFIQLCLCDPDRVLKNLFALKRMIFLFPSYVYKESDLSVLHSMDNVFVSSPLASNKLETMGINGLKNVQCYLKSLEIEKMNTERYTFLYHSEWLEERGWKEMLFAYCNEFSDGSADLLISTNKNQSEVNSDIDRFLSLNNFDRRMFEGIYVLSSKELEDTLRFADCFVAPYLSNYYDNNVLTAMKCGIPLLISRLESYQFVCKKNTCWIVDFIDDKNLDTIQMGECMRRVFEDTDASSRKSHMAKSFIGNILGHQDVFSAIGESLRKHGAVSLSDLDIKMEKRGNVI